VGGAEQDHREPPWSEVFARNSVGLGFKSMCRDCWGRAQEKRKAAKRCNWSENMGVRMVAAACSVQMKAHSCFSLQKSKKIRLELFHFVKPRFSNMKSNTPAFVFMFENLSFRLRQALIYEYR
jgi:hypothetical protein